MTPLDFMGFLVLLFISLIASAVLHYGFRYYVVEGPWSFLSKIVVGYLGAYFGSALFGHWFAGLMYGDVYLLPALLGSFALLILLIDVTKTWHHHRHA